MLTTQPRPVAVAASLAVATSLAVAPPPLLAQDVVQIMERASERYGAIDGFCADFRQEIDVTLLREMTRSGGELCQQRPNRFEMRFDDPEGDRIVADGTHLWAYFRSTDDGQVFRSQLSATGGRYDLHQEFLSDPGERYDAELEGREVVDGRETFVIALRPLVPSPYVHARVWIDANDYLIRRLVITDEAESVRTVDLTNIRLNPSIPPERFRFTPPPGVQVIAS